MPRALLAAVVLLCLAAAPAVAELACAVCGLPLAGTYYRMPDGRKLCADDYDRQLPRCATCGQKIVGAYLILEGSTSVCRPCHDRYPHCFVCGIPVRAKGQKLADGRVLCGPHAATAVNDSERAAALFQQGAAAVVATLGPGMALEHPVDSIKIVDQESLARMLRARGRSGRDVLGLFLLRTRGEERTYHVYLVSGLPPDRLLTVAVHEYAHAWQSEHHDRYADCNDRLREGFAEWVAYRVNKKLGRKAEVQHLLAQQMPDYIEGLRLYLEIERKYGLSGVFRTATTKDRL